MVITFDTDSSVTLSGWSLTFNCIRFYCALTKTNCAITTVNDYDMEFGRYLAETINKEYETIHQFPDPVIWHYQHKQSSTTTIV
jgi:hypothetical protein